jgi:hypothetical protein
METTAQQYIWSALAGSALGLFGLIQPIFTDWLWKLALESNRLFDFTAIATPAIPGAIVGGVFGALLGLALWPARAIDDLDSMDIEV